MTQICSIRFDDDDAVCFLLV